MDFDTLLNQIVALLRRQGRVSYGALKGDSSSMKTTCKISKTN
jgi:hypothetical protein